MFKLQTIALVLLIALTTFAQQSQAATTTTQPAATSQPAAKKLAPFTKRAGYLFGVEMGMQFRQQAGVFGLDKDEAIRAFTDILKGRPSALSDETVKKTVAEINAKATKFREAQQQMAKQAANANQATGEKFLAENGKRKDVVTTASGLQYEIIKAGTGPKPKKTDTVTLHYEGTLVNGNIFDSSIKRGQPATFPVSGVVPGFSEAIQLMPVGSKWRVVIPGNLAYGDSPRSPGGPNSTLIFEIELLSIATAKTAK